MTHSRFFVVWVVLLAASLGACGQEEAAAPEAPEDATAAAPPATESATPAPPPAPERPVDSETLPYAEVDEQLVYGYFAFPSDMIEPLPAVIMVHDWWGLNDDIRSTARRLAAEGYMVLAVDLYDGETYTEFADAREKMITVIESPDTAEENIRQALDFVSVAGAPGKASIGWGLGGAWSLNTAILFPAQLDAAIVYYGQVPIDEERLSPIDAPVLGLFGAKDRGVSADSVTEFSAAMHRLRKNHIVHVYPDVGAAFADPSRPTFNADIAADAWQRAIDFLAINLADGES